MQKLWSPNTDWDSPPPDDIRQSWLEFARNLTEMAPLSIPRCMIPTNSVRNQLIGFADASSVAHGCCIYLRCIDNLGNVQVNLLCFKSRINPLKNELTILRLELNAALLLIKLTKKVLDTLSTNNIKISDTNLFSNSQIVLALLKTDPEKT